VPSPWEMKATATLLPEKKKNTTRSKRHATSCFLCRAAHPPAAAAGRKLQERRRRHRHVISAAVAANGHAATTRSSAGRAVGSSRRSRCSAATGPATLGARRRQCSGKGGGRSPRVRHLRDGLLHGPSSAWRSHEEEAPRAHYCRAYYCLCGPYTDHRAPSSANSLLLLNLFL
jgi:hypothetical protein